jgi:hypothetical protein
MRLFTGPLTIALVLAATAISFAEELSIKISKQFGSPGPVRGDTYYPHDWVRFRAFVSGLESDKIGEVSVRSRFDVRDSDGRVIVAFPEKEESRRPTWVPGRFEMTCGFPIPAEAAGKELELVVVVIDVLADKQIEARSRITVKDVPGLLPSDVRFSSGPDGRTSSGRFVEGDVVEMHFGIANMQSSMPGSLAHCSLTFFEAENPSIPLKNVVQFSLSREAVKPEAGKLIAARFQFAADRKFKGFARLTIRVDGEEPGNSVDIPFEVLDPVE